MASNLLRLTFCERQCRFSDHMQLTLNFLHPLSFHASILLSSEEVCFQMNETILILFVIATNVPLIFVFWSKSVSSLGS